jgi:hypothetical protein
MSWRGRADGADYISTMATILTERSTRGAEESAVTSRARRRGSLIDSAWPAPRRSERHGDAEQRRRDLPGAYGSWREVGFMPVSSRGECRSAIRHRHAF